MQMRGEKKRSHLSASLDACFLTTLCKQHWKSLTLDASTIACGSRLCTEIKPSADRAINAKNTPVRRSLNWRLCMRAPARVGRLGNSTGSKNACNCDGPLPMTDRWIMPSMAMSRRVLSGARLQFRSACSAVMPIFLKNPFCTLSKCTKCVLQEW